MAKTKTTVTTSPSGGISSVHGDVATAMLLDMWERVRATIETAAADGSLAEATTPEDVAVLLAFVREHDPLARSLFQSGFMASVAMAASVRTMGEAMAGDACPIHGPGGCHRTVGRA